MLINHSFIQKARLADKTNSWKETIHIIIRDRLILYV